jgi:hypothetical protein
MKTLSSLKWQAKVDRKSKCYIGISALKMNLNVVVIVTSLTITK